MTTRRARSAHVRPRPPSSGHSPQPVRAKKPDPYRVRQHRGLDGRRHGLPLPTRLLLGLSVAALGGAVFLTASGGIGPMVSALGASFSGAFERIVATPVPSASVIVATNSPIINPVASPYSRAKTIDLTVTVPSDVVGTPNAKVRVYVALQGHTPAPVKEVPIGSLVAIAVPVDLTKGRNDFTATIVRDGVESEPSPIVTIILDQDPPKITIKSPKAGSTINAQVAKIVGSTKAGANLIARNDANGTSISSAAGPDGSFTMILQLESGTNAIHITATDLAGNSSTTDLSYVQGSGKMSANLSSSLYRISVAHPPGSLQLTVVVTDSTGAPVAGATAFFTLQIPGLGPISGQATTGADGRASFTTTLVGKMSKGNGQATVLVTHPIFGQTTDRVGLTFV